MEKKEGKILKELRRRGKIFEDPAPKVGGLTGWLIDLFTKVDHVHIFLMS